ncbi:RING finger protein 37 [Armigeres subalbatus]|uniref:RING finger protein 37 n=1 Tax=Armigeres subalbatus TaxID=124917 RepID=UPI002ED0C68D
MDRGATYNFLDHKLKPSIRCDTVDDDFHPISNLISSDPKTLELGFMPYPVTKPPVEIVFSLHCPIVMHRLKLWVQIGALRTTAVDVYIQNKRGIFDKVGCGESESAEIFEFINNRRVSSPSVPLDTRISQNSLFPTVGYLLADCSTFKVTLKKTARCVPVLRKIECWGQPARSCTKEVKENIERIWYKTTDSMVKKPATPCNKPHNIDPITAEIPEEFLDELTCDIMTIPMILPSGKIVDQMTIEKHNQQEEKWGRQASDPFTSLIYTDVRKPVFNAALKSRIDQFLIKNSNSLQYHQVPRTVGTVLRTATTNPLQIISPRLSRKRKLDGEPPKLNLSCSSLESAVRKALATTTRYTLAIDDRDDKFENACHSCMKSLGSFYKISTCQHLICRDCLDVQIQIPPHCKCSCGVVFESKSVEKHHFS